jgi:hypothetical protein
VAGVARSQSGYAENMRSSGGLKLILTAPQRDDRRVRFAHVGLVSAGTDEEIALLTDARGRLRYHLPPGNYRLRLDDGVETRFSVDRVRWTVVRPSLP